MNRRAATCLVSLALLAGLAARSEQQSDPASLYAAHGGPGAFFNPWERAPLKWGGVLRWKLFSRNPHDKRRIPVVPRVENDGAELSTRAPRPALTWVGHATVAIHVEDGVVLTDPHFSKRALIPARASPPGVPLAAIPPDAFAVISHNHYDHLDGKTVLQLPASVRWFVPLGLASWFRDRGRENVVELDWWEKAEIDGWSFTCLPSQHWSQRTPFDQNASLWCAWLIESSGHRFFFAGDTGYFHGFSEFRRRFGRIDVAMLPIGAYEPRWFMKYQHMNPAEAYRAFRDLDADYLLPIHWGTFDLTDEPLDLAPRALFEAVAEAGGDATRVVELAIGERFELEPPTID